MGSNAALDFLLKQTVCDQRCQHQGYSCPYTLNVANSIRFRDRYGGQIGDTPPISSARLTSERNPTTNRELHCGKLSSEDPPPPGVLIHVQRSTRSDQTNLSVNICCRHFLENPTADLHVFDHIPCIRMSNARQLLHNLLATVSHCLSPHRRPMGMPSHS